MIDLGDVRERVWEGVNAHGWPAVLATIANMLGDNADDMQAAGMVDTAIRLGRASTTVRKAAEQSSSRVAAAKES